MCRLYPTVCAALHVGGSAIRSTSTYRDKLVTVHKYTLRLGSSRSHSHSAQGGNVICIHTVVNGCYE